MAEETHVVEETPVDVAELHRTIAEKDSQIYVLTEMLGEYQQKLANETLTGANLRATLKLEQERSSTTAGSQ